ARGGPCVPAGRRARPAGEAAARGAPSRRIESAVGGHCGRLAAVRRGAARRVRGGALLAASRLRNLAERRPSAVYSVRVRKGGAPGTAGDEDAGAASAVTARRR